MKNIARLCFLFCVFMFPFIVSAHYKTSEFEGEWILSSTSSGGVGVNTGPGVASAVLRHVTLDKFGVGTENNGSFVFYLPDGTLTTFQGVNSETIKLTLTDQENGAGYITIVDTGAFNGTTVYNFIATKTRHGHINKLFLILVSEFGNKVVVTGVLERQQPD